MSKYSIICPCCGEKINVHIGNDGNLVAFLLDKKSISQSELSKKYGIELGVVESGVSNE